MLIIVFVKDGEAINNTGKEKLNILAFGLYCIVFISRHGCVTHRAVFLHSAKENTPSLNFNTFI